MKKILFLLLCSIISIEGSSQIISSPLIYNTPHKYELQAFDVNYRTTDYPSYLATASPWGALAAGSRVIEFNTIAPDGAANANAVAGCAYIPDPIGGDKIVVNEIDGTIASFFPANDMQTASRLFTVSGSRQGIAIDPINQHLHIYNNAGSMVVKNFAGTTQATYTAPPHSTDVLLYYDYNNPGTWYVSRENAANSPVEIWKLNGSTISITEVKWYDGQDGICLSQTGDLINFDASSSNARARWQSLNGKSNIFLADAPLSFVTEGILEYPDLTVGACDPAGYFLHGSLANGNGWIHYDPKNVYLKHNRSPQMTSFSTNFSGGVVSGYFYGQKITAGVGEKIYSPVYDTDTFTNTENASAWTSTFSQGGDADITWVTSNSAPTGSPTTATWSNLPTYAGWGSTIPSTEAAIPGTDRYKQAVLKVKDKADDGLISVQELIDGLAPNLKILVLEYDDGSNYVYNDSNTPTFQVPLAVNQVEPSNSFINATSSQRRSYDYANDQTTGTTTASHGLLKDRNRIINDQVGTLTIYGHRVIATTRAVYLSASIDNTATEKLWLGHAASSDSPASEIKIEYWDATGAVVYRAGIANTSITDHRIDFRSSGSTNTIAIDMVDQTLNVSVGDNTGVWFGDLLRNTRVATGLVLGSSLISGRHESMIFIYGDAIWTSDQNTLISNFIAQF